MLRPITGGTVSGTDTIDCHKQILGGVLISTDTTNAATVKIQNDSSSGSTIFELVTKQAQFIPLEVKCSNRLYISITGTSATAMLYEYIA